MEIACLKQQLGTLPEKPGVYIMRDRTKAVLYVGKAGSLRHRVASYFGAQDKQLLKTQHLMDRVEHLEFFVTDSEQEAFLLECNLIKKHRPRYNVRLKDDKTYPYLKVSLNEEWPRVYVTRQLENDKARYFGPYASAGSVRQTLSQIRRLFPVRSCRKPIRGTDSRPCLDYHLGRCLGPCIGAVSKGDYHQVAREVILFLEGKQEIVVQQLRRRMDLAADKLEFEKATLLRDQINAVERVIERQKISSAEGEMDVLAFAQASDQAYMQVFFIRNGKLLGREHFILEGTQDEEISQIMGSFVSQFYESVPDIPPLILLQHPVIGMELVEEWLSSVRETKVDLRVPKRGIKKDLVNMVAENARQGLAQRQAKLVTEPEIITKALADLQRELDLPYIPGRVECYDISNIQGTSAVGSMIVFEQGMPRKAHYRRFKIRTVEGANDYAMIREVLARRFGKFSAGDNWGIIPELILIDGGKGQLSAAAEVMGHMGYDSVPVTSIAKEREEIFVLGRSEPIILPRNSTALYLIQRMRDEAHRFALSYHQRVRQRNSMSSALDSIPGIGPKRKQDLLQRFGSTRGVRNATVEEIASVRSISASLSRKVKECL